jgi:hypothetical protein
MLREVCSVCWIVHVVGICGHEYVDAAWNGCYCAQWHSERLRPWQQVEIVVVTEHGCDCITVM